MEDKKFNFRAYKLKPDDLIQRGNFISDDNGKTLSIITNPDTIYKLVSYFDENFTFWAQWDGPISESK